MKDSQLKEKLFTTYMKCVSRKQIADNRSSPYMIQVNNIEQYPIFVDARDNLLVTGQTFSNVTLHAMALTKQLLEKNHIVHATTNFETAKLFWSLLFCFGFVTDRTAQRHEYSGRHKKGSPRFAFHLFHENHQLIEDTINDGQLTGVDIDPETPVEIVFYLKKHIDPSVGAALESGRPLEETLDLLNANGQLITKIIVPSTNQASAMPSPSTLSSKFGHIVVSYEASDTAHEYKNRLHLRDVLKSMQIYLKGHSVKFGWTLHNKPLGHCVIITGENEPVLQRTHTQRTPFYFTWRKSDGQ